MDPARVTTLLASLAVFFIALELTMIAVALPSIANTFSDASAAQLSSVFTAYNWVTAVLLLAFGLLADQYGRKRTFLVGLAMFALGSLGCGLASTIDQLIMFRMLQALGGAAMAPSSLALILAATNNATRANALAVWGMMAGVAAAVGPLVGVALMEVDSWRLLFFLPVPVICCVIAVGTGWLEESTALKISDAQKRSLPQLLQGLLSTPSFTQPTAASLGFVAGFIVWLISAPLFFVEVWGYTVTQAGLALAPAPIAMAIFAKPAARLSQRSGIGPLNRSACLLALGACIWWITALDSAPNYLVGFLPGALALGAAVGAGFPLLTTAAMRDVSADNYALAAGTHTTVRQLAMGLGAALTALAINHGQWGLNTASIFGFQLAWCIAGALFIAARVVLMERFSYPGRGQLMFDSMPQPIRQPARHQMKQPKGSLN